MIWDQRREGNIHAVWVKFDQFRPKTEKCAGI